MSVSVLESTAQEQTFSASLGGSWAAQSAQARLAITLACLLVFASRGAEAQMAVGMSFVPNEQRLAGKVRVVRVETAAFSNEGGTWREGERKLVSVTRYDPDGNKVEETYYRAGAGSTDKPQTTRYAHHSTPSAREIDQYDGSGKLVSKRVQKQNAKGEPTEEEIYGEDGSVAGRTTYFYDAAGRESEEVHYPAADQVGMRVILSYDASGHVTEYRMLAGALPGAFDPTTGKPVAPDSLLARVVLIYGPDGREGEAQVYGPGGVLTSRISAINNSASGVDSPPSSVEQVSYAPDGSIADQEQTRTDDVDSRGNATKVSTFRWNRETNAYEPADVTYTTYEYY